MHDTATHRIRIDLAYDGTDYHGWAIQPGLPTVQDAVETGLATIFREPIPVTVAGRTDAGVHAARQVIHCDVPTSGWEKLVGNNPARPAEAAMVSKLNGVLARAIAPGDVRDDGTLTDPRSYGVYALDLTRSHGRRFRFGNHPVRMRELETEFVSCRLLHLFLVRDDAEQVCEHLNTES